MNTEIEPKTPKSPMTFVVDGMKYATVKAFALNQALEALNDLTLLLDRDDPMTKRTLEKAEEALQNLNWRK